MAQDTQLTFSLQARDWETIVGRFKMNEDAQIKRMITRLQAKYEVDVPPMGTEVVSITTKEGILVKLYTALAYLPLNFGRINTAIRAANNVADNYILTSIDAVDAKISSDKVAEIEANRKLGRAFLLIDIIDNN